MAPACSPPSRPRVDGVLDGAAHSQHHAGAHHQADDGQGQIQGGQALGAQPPGDKEGVGQDIAGQPDHPGHVQGGVAEKIRKKFGGFHQVPPKTGPAGGTKKAPAPSIFNGLTIEGLTLTLFPGGKSKVRYQCAMIPDGRPCVKSRGPLPLQLAFWGKLCYTETPRTGETPLGDSVTKRGAEYGECARSPVKCRRHLEPKDLVLGCGAPVAVLVLVGMAVIRVLMKLVDRLLERSKSLASLHVYIRSMVRVGLWFLLV